eukprot:sb/3477951/
MQVKGLRKYESEVYAGGRTMMKGLASAGRLPYNLNEVAETWKTGRDGSHVKFKYVRLQVFTITLGTPHGLSCTSGRPPRTSRGRPEVQGRPSSPIVYPISIVKL